MNINMNDHTYLHNIRHITKPACIKCFVVISDGTWKGFCTTSWLDHISLKWLNYDSPLTPQL